MGSKKLGVKDGEIVMIKSEVRFHSTIFDKDHEERVISLAPPVRPREIEPSGGADSLGNPATVFRRSETQARSFASHPFERFAVFEFISCLTLGWQATLVPELCLVGLESCEVAIG